MSDLWLQPKIQRETRRGLTSNAGTHTLPNTKFQRDNKTTLTFLYVIVNDGDDNCHFGRSTQLSLVVRVLPSVHRHISFHLYRSYAQNCISVHSEPPQRIQNSAPAHFSLSGFFFFPKTKRYSPCLVFSFLPKTITSLLFLVYLMGILVHPIICPFDRDTKHLN